MATRNKNIPKKKPLHAPSSECHRVFLNCKSDLVLFGGGAGCGKSHQALMLILKYINDPYFRGVFIRQTNPQLSQSGGLFQEAQDMWKHYGATFKSHPVMMATFPSGAQVQFKVCGSDRDVSNFDGGQYSLVIFDEAQHHTETQVRYLESRIRSKAKAPHQMICTCNPKYDSWMLPFVLPYLDPVTGIPTDETFAKERYYAAYNGMIVTTDTIEEMLLKYPNVKPRTYTFIKATIRDNPIMSRLNPSYVSQLENLKRVERERLLLGSWFAKQTAAGYFRRENVIMIDSPPKDAIARARGMDLASSLPSESYPNPDWTASVLASRTASGYVIEHVERYRKLTNGVLEHIVDTDKRDRGAGYDQVPVIVPKDTGSAGAIANAFIIKYLQEHGVNAKTEIVNGHSGKLARMQPFLAMVEAGLVSVVKGDWNDMFFNELEDFIDGNRNQKDDMFDSTGTVMKFLMKSITIPQFTIPSLTQPSPIPKIK